jgi:hypothetical protein
MTLSSATAAKPVTRATAERALSQFLERVTQVNQNPYFLVVLFGEPRGGIAFQDQRGARW